MPFVCCMLRARVLLEGLLSLLLNLLQLFLSHLKLKYFLLIAKDSYLKRRIVMPTLAFFEFVGVVELVGGQ